MIPNPILEELRETREELLAAAGGTLAGLVAQLQEDQRKSERPVLDPSELRRKRQANRHIGDEAQGELELESQSSPH